MDKDLEEIRRAAEGLMYVSETEAPFEVVLLKTGDIRTELLSSFPEDQVEETNLDWFFRNMVKFYPADPPGEKLRAEKFLALKKLLEEKLQDIRVIRAGKIRIDAYILGRLPHGQIAGLKTHLVET